MKPTFEQTKEILEESIRSSELSDLVGVPELDFNRENPGKKGMKKGFIYEAVKG